MITFFLDIFPHLCVVGIVACGTAALHRLMDGGR